MVPVQHSPKPERSPKTHELGSAKQPLIPSLTTSKRLGEDVPGKREETQHVVRILHSHE